MTVSSCLVRPLSELRRLFSTYLVLQGFCVIFISSCVEICDCFILCFVRDDLFEFISLWQSLISYLVTEFLVVSCNFL